MKEQHIRFGLKTPHKLLMTRDFIISFILMVCKFCCYIINPFLPWIPGVTMDLSLDFEGNANNSHKAANECKDIYKESFLSSFLRQKAYYFNLTQSHGKCSFFLD